MVSEKHSIDDTRRIAIGDQLEAMVGEITPEMMVALEQFAGAVSSIAEDLTSLTAAIPYQLLADALAEVRRALLPLAQLGMQIRFERRYQRQMMRHRRRVRTQR